MTDKVYYPETIEPNMLPVEGEITFVGEKQSPTLVKPGDNKTLSPHVYKGELPPAKIIPADVVGSSFNTQSKKILDNFTFGTLGAIQVGVYENGVSGDVRISPTGILARNDAGVTTFSLDGSTGDATFLGTIVAGSVISASISADNITTGTLSVVANVGDTSVKIDGANRRITVNDGSDDRGLFGKLIGAF